MLAFIFYVLIPAIVIVSIISTIMNIIFLWGDFKCITWFRIERLFLPPARRAICSKCRFCMGEVRDGYEYAQCSLTAKEERTAKYIKDEIGELKKVSYSYCSFLNIQGMCPMYKENK